MPPAESSLHEVLYLSHRHHLFLELRLFNDDRRHILNFQSMEGQIMIRDYSVLALIGDAQLSCTLSNPLCPLQVLDFALFIEFFYQNFWRHDLRLMLDTYT